MQRNVAHTASEHDHMMTFHVFFCYLDQRRLKGRDAGGQGHTMKSAVYGRTSLSHGVTDRGHGHVSGGGIRVMTGRVIKGKSTVVLMRASGFCVNFTNIASEKFIDSMTKTVGELRDCNYALLICGVAKMTSCTSIRRRIHSTDY